MIPTLRPALLVIDMQNDFLTPGSRLFNEGALALLPSINHLTEAARAARVPVVWVIQEHRRQLVDFGREGDISPVHCVEGTMGAQLVGGLAQSVSDFRVVKRRFSGFHATDLDLLLRCLDRNAVLLAGINSDGCVLATAVDAHARDYYVRVVAQATSGWDEAAHAAALASVSRLQPAALIALPEALALFAGQSLNTQ